MIIRNFGMYFPTDAKHAIEYIRLPTMYELIVKLDNGDVVLYDDLEHTARYLPRNNKTMSEEVFKKEFGLRLHKLMFRKGLTQSMLSKLTGISQVQLSDYITGRHMPSFYKVYKIAIALDCDIDELTYYNEY